MYLFFTFVSEPPGGSDAWGIFFPTAIAAGVQVLYGFAVFPAYVNKNPVWSGLISYILFAIMAATLVHLSAESAFQYSPIWAIVIFLGGMFGWLVLSLVTLATMIYYSFIVTELITQSTPPISGTELIVTVLLALLSYVLWHNVRVEIPVNDKKKKSKFDITESLKSSTLINSIVDGLILIDSQGVIEVFNPAAAQITLWNAEEAKGLDYKSILRFFDDKGSEFVGDQNPIAQCFLTAKPVKKQSIILKNHANKPVELDLIVSPVVEEGEDKKTGIDAAMVIFRDVSKQRGEERQRAEFISTASHEMRTPVAAIEGYLALALNEKVSKIDSHARSYLEKAHTSTKHLGKLFQDLLTAAKSEDGRLTSHPVVIEVGHFLQEITDRLKFTAEKKGLSVYYGFGDKIVDTSRVVEGKVVEPIYYIYADPDRMREVLTNLFDNAVKYTEEGKITISMAKDGDNVVMMIADTGPGISKEDVPHLFQKFYRVDNSDTRQIGGTGLGLFICKKIVELYNGKIWVESETGKGSVFKISMPIIPPEKAKEMLKNESLNASPLDPNAPRPEVDVNRASPSPEPASPPATPPAPTTTSTDQPTEKKA